MAVTPTPSAVATPASTPGPSALASSSFQATLEELGYSERILFSPWGGTQYSFKLPYNWLVESDSYLDLEFSYFFTELGRRREDELELTFFGELLIDVDGRLLQVYSLDAPTLEHVHLRLDLPPELLNEQPGTSHQISLELDASFLCNMVHKAQLVIHPESTLFLSYSLLPPTLDLADYPRPFYQRSFDPDQVRFVLPAQPSEMEMREVAGIAAKLGELTDRGMVISATTDVDWLATVETGQAGSEHLFVIGQPSRNKLIAWLNDHVDLPVSMRRREMALSTQGPTAVMPGDTFSYTITVTNTTPVSATSLSLIDKLPRQARLVSCRPSCAKVGRSEVSWQLASLSPSEVISCSLTLQLTDTVQLSPDLLLENTVVLADGAQVPLNISSLTMAVGPIQEKGMQAVSSNQDDYFFTQNGQPVPEGDGILQEIISPWDSEKVVLLVTGVNEEAIYKASQALSLETHFPGMKGPTALIRQVRPSPPITATLAADFTLADLGYADKTVYGAYSQEIAYWFSVPLGWQLTDEAYLRLLLSHSEAIDEQGSTLTVLLNDNPLAGVALNKDNAIEGVLEVNLPDSRIKYGTSNEISIRVWMQLNEDECERIDIRQVWLNISQDSLLHLDHRVQGISVLDLDYFPFPFNTQSDLSDVLFVLPTVPGLVEQEGLLRLAAVLGDATNGSGFSPAVSLGGALDAEILNRYHIIAIGRPSVNPFIQQVNFLLPQPFMPGTDEVEHQVGEVLLRLPPDTSLGYIQEIPSPWNEHRALLVVTGTTEEGVVWATYASSRQIWRLAGNLVLVREGGEKVQSIDTRGLTSSGLTSAVTTAVPELTPVATLTPTLETGMGGKDTPVPLTPPPSAAGGKGSLPTWVMLLAGTTVVIVVGIFGIAAWQLRRQRR